jgi:hypothetical protein
MVLIDEQWNQAVKDAYNFDWSRAADTAYRGASAAKDKVMAGKDSASS